MKIINSLTQETLREESYENPDAIHSFIESFKESKDSPEGMFLFDSKHRTWNAKYVSYFTRTDGNTMIYKLFFKAKLYKLQVPISNFIN